jgi:FkbM family methyltransferase
MKNVGQSNERNKEYSKLFSREKLIQKLVKNKTPVLFDIGAHHGETVQYLKELFEKSTIYSFEPDPESFQILSSKAVSGVYYYNLALSDADGSSIFYRNKVSHTNSLLKVNLKSEDSIKIATSKAKGDGQYISEFNFESQVDTITLDSFAKVNFIENVDLLKIDVQGAESKVLSGGGETLKKTAIVVLEISFFDYYEHQTSFLDVELLLSPLGFKLYSISEISNNPMNGRTDWAEVVYINNNLHASE